MVSRMLLHDRCQVDRKYAFQADAVAMIPAIIARTRYRVAEPIDTQRGQNTNVCHKLPERR